MGFSWWAGVVCVASFLLLLLAVVGGWFVSVGICFARVAENPAVSFMHGIQFCF